MIDKPVISTSSTLALAAAKPGEVRKRVVLCNISTGDIFVCPGDTAVLDYGIGLKANGGSWTDQPDSTGYMYQGIYTAISASPKNLSVTVIP